MNNRRPAATTKTSQSTPSRNLSQLQNALMIRLKSEHATRRAIAEELCRVAGTKLQRDCYGKSTTTHRAAL